MAMELHLTHAMGLVDAAICVQVKILQAQVDHLHKQLSSQVGKFPYALPL